VPCPAVFSTCIGASIGCQASFGIFFKRKTLVVVAAAELWETKAEGPGFPSGCGKARSVLAERLSKEVVGNLWAGPPVHRFSIASGRHGRSAAGGQNDVEFQTRRGSGGGGRAG